MSILEKILKKHFPYDRLPTIEECRTAIGHPGAAEPWVKEYLQRSPEYERYLRSCSMMRQGNLPFLKGDTKDGSSHDDA